MLEKSEVTCPGVGVSVDVCFFQRTEIDPCAQAHITADAHLRLSLFVEPCGAVCVSEPWSEVPTSIVLHCPSVFTSQGGLQRAPPCRLSRPRPWSSERPRRKPSWRGGRSVQPEHLQSSCRPFRRRQQHLCGLALEVSRSTPQGLDRASWPSGASLARVQVWDGLIRVLRNPSGLHSDLRIGAWVPNEHCKEGASNLHVCCWR